MLYNNKNLKVGDRVYGEYETNKYYGIVVNINPSYCQVDLYEDKTFKHCHTRNWDCKRRKDGNYACAAGCDDGLHNLKILKNKNIEIDFYGKYL